MLRKNALKRKTSQCLPEEIMADFAAFFCFPDFKHSTFFFFFFGLEYSVFKKRKHRRDHQETGSKYMPIKTIQGVPLCLSQ